MVGKNSVWGNFEPEKDIVWKDTIKSQQMLMLIFSYFEINCFSNEQKTQIYILKDYITSSRLESVYRVLDSKLFNSVSKISVVQREWLIISKIKFEPCRWNSSWGKVNNNLNEMSGASQITALYKQCPRTCDWHGKIVYFFSLRIFFRIWYLFHSFLQ